MIVRRDVTVGAKPKAVFDYLSDFTTTTEWDPGTVTTTLVDGDGGVGTTYRNTTSFAGRETQLTYEVIEYDAPNLIRLRGENKAVVAVDTITVEKSGSGSYVVYEADFQFKGAWKLAAPFLRPAFKKLGDEAEEGLQKYLGRLSNATKG